METNDIIWTWRHVETSITLFADVMGNSTYETLSSLLLFFIFYFFLGPYFSSDLISPVASIWNWWWLWACPSYLRRFYWQWSVRLIRVSLKKLVEQQAFEFLLILSTCSWFDAESALVSRYLVIIGYWKSRSDTAFRGTVEGRASRGYGFRLHYRTAWL